MAKRFLTHLDIAGNQILNAAFEKLANDPTTGNFEGRIYYNTADDLLKVHDGTNWKTVGAIVSVQGTTNEVEVSVVNGVATISLPSTINSDTSGNAATATKLATSRTIELTGDVTGTASFDGSANASITATIAANSVALGTDTTGDYVASVSASDGISATGTGEGATVALTNTDKGSSQNIFKNIAVGGTTVVADTNNDTVTLAEGTGIGLSANATTDTITVSNTGVTSISGTTNQITASASTGSVTLSLPSAVTFPGSVTLNADPTQALHAATKQYVDEVAEGLKVKPAVQIATTENLDSTYDNGTSGVGATLTGTSNGAFPTIDGVTLTSITSGSNGVLVKNQATPAQNGRYNLTQVGDSEEPWILTRCGLCDQSSEIPGMYVFVKDGTVGEGTGWVAVVSNPATFTIGTDAINFTQFSGTGTYTAGNGLTLSGTQFSINTGVTVDLTTAQTLTNKTLTSPTITSPSVSGLYLSDGGFVVEGATADGSETTVVFTDPTADRTITFKDESGTVAYTSDISAITTTGVAEGTNLYFTDERAQDAVGNIISGSNSLSATYTDASNTIAFDTTLATTSYMSKTSGLAVNISALETKLTTDGYTKKVSANVGDASATSFAITHNIGTRDVTVQVYDTTSYDTVECDVVRTDANNVTVSFTLAPASNAYRVVIIG
jgi:hypothetical protein